MVDLKLQFFSTLCQVLSRLTGKVSICGLKATYLPFAFQQEPNCTVLDPEQLDPIVVSSDQEVVSHSEIVLKSD